MPGSYSPSTVARIGDIKNGLLVTTAELPYTSFGAANTSIFTVYGRILVWQLFFEVTVLWVNATTMKFTWTGTSPVQAIADASAACTSMDTFAAGRRVVYPGTTNATAASVANQIGQAQVTGPTVPALFGNIVSAAVTAPVGVIGYTTATAAASASAGRFSILYTPVDDGSYVQALV